MEKQNKIVGGLTFIALVCLVAAYFAPIWWVSLTAPNYPADAFPGNVRKTEAHDSQNSQHCESG